MNVNVLVDASGSMTENDKESVVKYLLYAINGYANGDNSFSIKLFQWGNRLIEVESVFKVEIEEGRASDEVVEFLRNHSEDKNFIITDGGFTREIKNGIRTIPDRKDIYYVGVGCDCNMPSLRSVADSEHIYLAQDAISCLKKC
ncbi:hypothetical protein E5357_07565 [Hominisplanchenecus murintestinalis]|uniref:Uncharacterized protein n=1 Tax=Hominisplanchenecus murintestinalis TaxID=2941517 RepID=A0AC61R0Y3_9FIRM|nr:hypothetical protein [Hominisplanchenecus murintestinalis]TGX98813.1 hypothetical protein E5357_07565 [Hominisplanchenecus murintestinalis]